MNSNPSEFVPALLTARLSNLPSDLRVPAAAPFEGAVMFADISGFTALSESLVPLGRAGGEKLSEILDQFFQAMFAIIHSHGGHVLRIAGDAPLVVWEGEHSATHAAACALAVQQRLHQYEAGPVRLTLRIALTGGALRLASLGSDSLGWEWVLLGECLGKLDQAGRLAQPGQVVLCNELFARIQGEAEALPDGYYLLSKVDPPLAPLISSRPQPVEPKELQKRMLSYLPFCVKSRLEAGLLTWMAELRRISVLFFNLSTGQGVTLERLQGAMLVFKTVFESCEGSLNQFLVDDKGTVCVAAFGLPPWAHHDDPARAVKAALEIRARLKELELETDIGITTGNLFCGTRGGDGRREYCMIGSRVNLAARLMQAAAGHVLCDETTFQAVKAELDFHPARYIKVKGKEEPMAVYQARSESRVNSQPLSPLVGRASELDRLREWAATESDRLWLQGEPGIGKSRLVSEALTMESRRSLVCRAQVTARDLPLQALLPLLQPLWERTGMGYEVLGERFGRASVAAKNMTPEARAEALVQECLNLLKDATDLFVVEDCQWLDSTSLDIVKALSRSGWKGSLLITSRSNWTLPEDLTGFSLLELGPLTSEEVNELAAALPQSERLSSVLGKARGNPFFLQELAFAVAEGLEIPESLRGLIVSRIDRLFASHQLTLKVASVIGTSFSVDTVAKLYPVEEASVEVPDYLQELKDREFLGFETMQEVQFRHDLTREVAYELLLFSQKRQLHRQAAEWFETGNEQQGLEPLIAYHWEHADEPARAVEYLETAASNAQRDGLYHAAAEFLEKIRSLGGATPSHLRRLGEAYYGAGHLQTARSSLEECARALGRPVPRGWPLWLNYNVLSVVLCLGLLRWFPSGLKGLERAFKLMLRYTPTVPPAEQERRQEASACHETLSVLYAFSGNMTESMYCGGLSFELIYGCPESPQLARAYGNSALGMGLVGMFELAGEFAERAVSMPASRSDVTTRSCILHYASMPFAVRGSWSRISPWLAEAEEILLDSGSRRQRGELLLFLAYIAYYQASLEEFERRFEQLESTIADNDGHQRAWLGFGRQFVRWYNGHPVEPEYLRHVRDVIHDESDKIGQANLLALLAATEGEDCLAYARRFLALKAAPEMAFYQATAYQMLGEALCRLGTVEALQMLKLVVARLQTASLFIPVTRPLVRLLQSRFEEGTGRVRAARRTRQRGLAEAYEFATPVFAAGPLSSNSNCDQSDPVA